MTTKKIMSSPLITINSNSLRSADMMLQNNIRHLLVVVDDDDKSNLSKPIGIFKKKKLQDIRNT